jgi:hypothetical protein
MVLIAFCGYCAAAAALNTIPMLKSNILIFISL